MARKIDQLPQTAPKWHGIESPGPDKQTRIEQALNDGTIAEDEARELAEMSHREVISYLHDARSAIQERDEESKPIASYVAGHDMSLDEATNTYEIQSLMWTLSHRVMQVRDTHKRMTEYGREVYDHAHRIGSIDGPRPMPVYSPDAISEYNRACSEYRIAADIIHSALSHFGVGEEDRKTLIERAITSGLLKYR